MKWLRDTQAGFGTNPLCRYLLINTVVSLFLLTFIGIGYVFVWQALPHGLLAMAPFNPWAVSLLNWLGWPTENIEKLRTAPGSVFWIFIVMRLLRLIIFLGIGLFLIANANFSLMSLFFTSPRP
jgi:hypothetical protein